MTTQQTEKHYEPTSDISAVSAANKVVRANTSGKIDGSFLNDFITLPAGENLTAGQAIALGVYQADGGVKYDNKQQGTWGNSSNPSFSFTVGNNPNRVIILYVYTDSSIGVVTYNGVTMTQVTSTTGTATVCKSFRLVAPTVGANTVQITAGTYGGYQIVSYYNADQTTGIDASFVVHADASPQSNNLTLLTAGDLTLTSSFTQGNASNPSNTQTGSVGNNAQGQSNFAMNSGNGIGNMITSDSGQSVNTLALTSGATYGGYGCVLIQIALKAATAVTYSAVLSSAKNSSTYTIPAVTNYRLNIIGFATNAASATQNCLIHCAGVMDGLSGLIPAANYYLSDTNGIVSLTAGTNSRKVGTAISTTQILLTHNF